MTSGIRSPCPSRQLTNLIAVQPWSEALEPGRMAGLRHAPVPLEAPPRVIELFWHQRHEKSALHPWLKNVLLGLFERPRAA